MEAFIKENEKAIKSKEAELKKFSKEELKEMAYSYRVPTGDGERDYPVSWIRYDVAVAAVKERLHA